MPLILKIAIYVICIPASLIYPIPIMGALLVKLGHPRVGLEPFLWVFPWLIFWIWWFVR